MFNKLLIANRGEIACRIIKTANEMGIETVAVYSSADKDSLHVKQATEAYWIGEAKASESYLNSAAIIAVAKACGAEAIHPGYGFLSENAEFAQACDEAQLIFVGPPIAAMQAMASKQLAKQRLEKTSVPLIPGYHGQDQSDAYLLEKAIEIGFPVLLKAACGGGGKGMRTVFNQDDFAQALAGARREALASFADDTMIIEKYITNPRHIEVQIMADNFGEVVHLFERDCSIQRRHQKIIEEAPAPNLSPILRQSLFKAACDVARAISYRGAGTIEFLVDNDQHFYFMEMNTRLQVEHPVTEMITGLDLVAWQLQIAANLPLPLQQEDIQIKGHAIECRIYAEDPRQNFIPSIGQLHFLKSPSGHGIRIDSGVMIGSIISQYYDPMMAKLIAHGQNREQALHRLTLALDELVIGGVTSNITFLQAICHNDRFIKAAVTTHFLEEETITLATVNQKLALLMAAAFDYISLFKNASEPLYDHCFAWQMHLSSHWSWRYLLEGEEKIISIFPRDEEHVTVRYDDKEYHLKIGYENSRLIIEDGQQIHATWIENHPSHITLYFSDGIIHLERFNGLRQKNSDSTSEGQLTAPMPATIVAILKKEGDVIKKGEALMVLEAMKMEHTIWAPKDGTLSALFYEIGQQVNEGAELLTLN